jgi:manganese-dependent inorganic pyrophosphatase
VEDAKILEIVDHHRLGGIKTAYPIRFNAQPVGSTSTIIAKEFFINKEKISKKTAGLLLAGILSDTVMFKSPTSTEEDREIAEKLAKRVGLDLQTFGIEVMRAKCDIGGKTVSQIVRGDLKEYDFSGEKVGIGALEIADFEDIKTMREQILQEMEKTRAERQWTMMLLLVTDVMRGDSKLLLVGERLHILEKAFGKTAENQTLYLENVMSRKKQIVPALEKTFKEMNLKI